MLRVVHIQGQKPRKLTYKQEVSQLAAHLMNKWRKRDAMNAERDLERIMNGK